MFFSVLLLVYVYVQLIMAGVWLIVEVSMLFFYFDFPTLTDAEAAGLYVPESGDTEYVSNETDPLLGHGKRHPVTSINETSQDHSVQLEASIEERRSGDSSSPPQSWKERMLGEYNVVLVTGFQVNRGTGMERRLQAKPSPCELTGYLTSSSPTTVSSLHKFTSLPKK